MGTFVLVHGAGTGGWVWDDVRVRLRQAGHIAYAPSLQGVGRPFDEGGPDVALSTHIDQLAQFVEDEGLDQVILVGFSYGGYVISGAADRLGARIARLVYVDGFVPTPGYSFLDLLPERTRTALRAATDAVGHGQRVPSAPLHMIGGVGDLEPGVTQQHVDSVLQRRGSHPMGTYTESFPQPSQPAYPPRVFVSCTQKPPDDPLIALADQLRAEGWPVTQLPAGHFPMVTMPTRLAGILMSLAEQASS